jgi:hypothetical protein
MTDPDIRDPLSSNRGAGWALSDTTVTKQLRRVLHLGREWSEDGDGRRLLLCSSGPTGLAVMSARNDVPKSWPGLTRCWRATLSSSRLTTRALPDGPLRLPLCLRCSFWAGTCHGLTRRQWTLQPGGLKRLCWRAAACSSSPVGA